MAQIKWTKGQNDAIVTDGGDILVSAAAGSGKTAVLTERAIRLMTGDNPMEADKMLIATFTNAAAGEMRRRIRAKLAALISEQPDDAWLRRQSRLLDNAQIGTVHSFCQRLIRQYFERLDVPPNFRLLSEEESGLYKNESAESVVAEAYIKGGYTYSRLVELLSSPGGDNAVPETIIKIHEFVSAHPFYTDWMDEKLSLYGASGGAGESIWGKALLRYASSALRYMSAENARLIEECKYDEKLEKSYLPAMISDGDLISRLSGVLRSGGWDEIATAFSEASFAKLGTIRGEHPTKEEIKSSRDIIKNTLKDLKKSFTLTEADFKADIEDLLPLIECLFDLVKSFDAEYSGKKRSRGALDFSDLEQMAISLLAERSPDGSLSPSDLALEVRKRFDAIMVDEYQDINAAQDTIFRMVSRGDNLFMVGDVKQSIYRFRQASPELFLRKMDSFSPLGGGFPALIRLANNFRSRKEVTDAVNSVFALLMSRDVGEMDYTASEWLIASEGPEMPSAGCEFIAVDTALAIEGQSELQLEADYVANHIRELIDSKTEVRDGDGFRPVAAGDIAILLSAPRTSALAFIRALEKLGIPSSSARRPEFLKSREIAPVIGLLAAIDNPLRDTELAAALISPLFGLNPDHLARLRTEFGGASVALSLRAAADSGDADFTRAYELFSELRRLSFMMPPRELLTTIYERTGYEVAIGMMQGGAQRLANLRLLVDYAISQAERGSYALSDFVGFIDKLLERGQDLSAAPPGSGGGVSVLSIHQSKGLEYPVVYLCHLAKGFNRMDLRSRAIIHPEYGFACVRRDPIRRIQYESLPFTAVKLESGRALMSEELRKLYVAMTRAKDRLVMTCAVKDARERLDVTPSSLDGDGRLPSYRVLSSGSVADWMLLCLPHIGNAGGSKFKITAVDMPYSKRAALDISEAESEISAEPDADLIAALTDRIDFVYPYMDAVKVPAKLSVSQLTKTDVTARFLRRPSFMAPGGISPTERGNAVHLFMQLCDYHLAATDAEAERLRLLGEGKLSAEQAAAVDVRRVREFFASELGGRVLRSERVLREFEFVAPAGRELIGKYLPGVSLNEGQMMIQGIADCVFFEGGRAVLLDYKTDYTSARSSLADRYSPQLEVYRELLPAFLGCGVSESYIYSFHLSEAIPVHLGTETQAL